MLMLEGHGREPLWQECNVSRTVGWFTSQFPVVLPRGGQDVEQTILEVKESLRKIPAKGMGYGLLRYLCQDGDQYHIVPQLLFNYLGEFKSSNHQEGVSIATEAIGPVQDEREARWFELEMTGIIRDDGLEMELIYDPVKYSPKEVTGLMDDYRTALIETITHCTQQHQTRPTPSDFSYAELTSEELEQIFKS